MVKTIPRASSALWIARRVESCGAALPVSKLEIVVVLTPAAYGQHGRIVYTQTDPDTSASQSFLFGISCGWYFSRQRYGAEIFDRRKK